jgi:hypothetical protein
MLFTLVIAVFLLINSSTLFARSIQGSIDLTFASPQGEFKDTLNDYGLGLGMIFGSRLGNSPFILGGDLSFHLLGGDTEWEYLDTIPEMQLQIHNKYNIAQLLGMLRFQPIKKGIFMPYVDFLAGFNYLYAETTIEDGFGEVLDRILHFDDISLAYGIGAGLIIRLGKKRPVGKTPFSINIRVKYTTGGTAEYLKSGSIVVENGDITYYVYESKTNFFAFQVGVWTSF